jgi:hemolysin III
MDDGQQAAFPWDYDRSEIIADGMIHAVGICLGLIGAVSMIVTASLSTRSVVLRPS